MAVPGTFTSGQVLTAAEMNDLPAGIVGSDVVTSTVNLTTSPQNTHTVTFTAVSGRKYVAMFCGLFQNNSVAGGEFQFDIDQDGTRRFAGRSDPRATNEIHSKSLMVELPDTSGSTTVTVECGMNSGTGDLAATSTLRSTLIVLDVGT